MLGIIEVLRLHYEAMHALLLQCMNFICLKKCKIK